MSRVADFFGGPASSDSTSVTINYNEGLSLAEVLRNFGVFRSISVLVEIPCNLGATIFRLPATFGQPDPKVFFYLANAFTNTFISIWRATLCATVCQPGQTRRASSNAGILTRISERRIATQYTFRYRRRTRAFLNPGRAPTDLFGKLLRSFRIWDGPRAM